jgi:D-xylonolactonase
VTATVSIVDDLRCELAEAPLWDGERSALYWIDIFGLAIHRLARDGRSSWSLPARPGGIALLPDGALLAPLKTGIHRFDPTTGECRLHAVIEPEAPDNRPNDCVVDGWGRLLVGTLDDTGRGGGGSVYRLSERGIEVMVERIGLSNGLGFSPGLETLYVTDSAVRAITAYDHDPLTGVLSNPRLFARDEDCTPDGLAVDVDGGVWSAKWGGGRVVRYAADGTLDVVVRLPVRNPTSLGFGGTDLDRLYVTTASCDSLADDRDLAAGAGLLFAVDGLASTGQSTRFAEIQERQTL